jgi:hypothetical protein
MSTGTTSTSANVSNASGTSALMAVNGLNYGANDSSMSVVSSRKYKGFCPLSKSYSEGDCMQFIFSSGSEYVNARNSYIKFKVKVDLGGTSPGTHVSFGAGKSAVNLFNEAVYTHSSGAEIDRTRDLNLLCAHKNKWEKSSDWRFSIGSAVGIDEGVFREHTTNLSDNIFSVGEEPTFIVPLCMLSDIFDQNGQLLPNYLVAGSRLDLYLAPALQAFVSNAATPSNDHTISYTITGAELVLDLYTLVDSVMRQLSAISASSGLSIDFSGYWNVPSNEKGLQSCITVSKALSQANAVHAIVRYTTYLSKTVLTQGLLLGLDSFNTIPASEVKDWQFVLGSQFIPQKAVSDSKETFYQTQNAWLKLDQALPNSVAYRLNYDQAVDASGVPTDASAYNASHMQSGIISLSLERNALLTNSGQAVSAQRGLQMIANWSTTDTDKKINLFIDYVRLVDVFTDQITVRL